MSSRSNAENCVNPRSDCGEKHESSVRTNKQTDPNAIPSPSARVINSRETNHLQNHTNKLASACVKLQRFWSLPPLPKVKEVMFSPLSVCLFVCLCTGYLKKVVDGFGQNLVDTLGVWQGRIDSILVKIRIQIWKQGLFNFEPILHHWETGLKRYLLHDILKSCGRIRTKLGGQVGCVARTNWFDFDEDMNPDPDLRIFFFCIPCRGSYES